MTAATKPVIIRRHPEPLRSTGDYVWEVRHDGELVAAFTAGERALNYVDCELSAWYRNRQRATVEQRAAQVDAVKSVVGSLIQSFIAKQAGNG